MAFIIWSLCACIFLIIGIQSRVSKQAVGFWSNRKPPEVTDVRKYNQAVAIIWFVFAIVFEILGVPLLFLKQNDPRVFITMIGTVLLIIGIMIAYVKVEGKYCNNRNSR